MSRVDDYRKKNKGGDYSRVEESRHRNQPWYSDDSIQAQMFRLSRPGYADTYSRTLEGVKLVPDVIVIYLPSALLEDV